MKKLLGLLCMLPLVGILVAIGIYTPHFFAILLGAAVIASIITLGLVLLLDN